LRYCWQILRYGRPYADQIIFNMEVAKAFVATLQKQIETKNE